MNSENYKKQINKFLEYYEKPLVSSTYDIISWLTWIFTNKVPYENLSKIIKDYELDKKNDINKFRLPDEVLEGHLSKRFGGTCFSITYTLSNLLDAFGIENHLVMADMRLGECVHCGILVKDNTQSYILDPGYMIPKPIPIAKYKPAYLKIPSNDVIMLYDEESNRYLLYTIGKNGKQVLRLKFHTEPVNFEDFKRYWERSFELESMDAVTIENINNDGLFYFRRNHIVQTAYGKKKNRVFDNSEEIAEYLNSFFGIDKEYILTAEQILKQRGNKKNNVIIPKT
jgi:arylamine N-acetyltransferase